MADKFTTLVEDSRQMIDEALERINEVMEEASASVQETGRVWEPDTVFADAVIGWLSDDNVIQILPSSPTPSSDGFPMTT